MPTHKRAGTGRGLAIDRTSSTPSYVQLAQALRARIASGALRPGARLPAESELIAATGLSRVTVRQALGRLEQQGLVVRKQGLGTFVAHPIDQELTSVRTITEVLLDQGITPEIRVLGFGPTIPPARVRQELGLGERERMLLIKRLYSYRRQPIALIYIYLPLSVREEAEILRRATTPTDTTYTIWEEKLGVRLKEGRHVIRAGAATVEDARALRIRVGAPILILERITYAEDGRPLEYILFHYHADRYEFSATLPRRRHRPGDLGFNGHVIYPDRPASAPTVAPEATP